MSSFSNTDATHVANYYFRDEAVVKWLLCEEMRMNTYSTIFIKTTTTTTNILILCGNIISQKRDLKSWLTKFTFFCQHFSFPVFLFRCVFVLLHVLSVEKLLPTSHAKYNWDVNVTPSCVNVHTQFYTFSMSTKIKE